MNDNSYTPDEQQQWNGAQYQGNPYDGQPYGQDPVYQQPQPRQQPSLGANVLSAVVFFFTSLINILFICPFGFWAAAVNRLAADRTHYSIDVIKSTSRWPYLTFCKKVFFEFAIDGLTFVSWFVGIIAAFVVLITGFAGGLKIASFLPFFLVLIGSYYSPLALALLRDLVVLLLLPFSKFLSWVSKPAQHLDIDMTKKS